MCVIIFKIRYDMNFIFQDVTGIFYNDYDGSLIIAHGLPVFLL